MLVVRFRNSLVCVLAGAGLLVMLSACQTSKHAEVMSRGTLQGQDGETGSISEEEIGTSSVFKNGHIQGLTSSDLMKDPDHMVEGDSGMMTDTERTKQDGTDFGLSHVFFAFDKYAIDDEATSVLQANARMLKKQYKDAGVLIEGHCDERGTVDYNLELGKRRAQAVKDYLIDLGVGASRIRIVSYGKEKPFCMESNSDCLAQNRRGHFLLQQ